jgi:REP element-mobilizing transposase RayT
VVAQGNARRRIVEDDHDRRAFIARFARVCRELGWRASASCLMDTHFHAVVETPQPNLARGMQRLKGGYAHWFNRRHGAEAHLFGNRYWSARVDSDAHLFRACLYVVVNPVAAGVCDHPRDWPWCSYRSTAEGDPSAYLPGEERLLALFGDAPAEARRRYAEAVDAAAEIARARRLAGGSTLWQSLEPFESRIRSDCR